MAAVFCDEGLAWLAKRIVGDTDTTNAPAMNRVRLFINDYTPTADSVRANFTHMGSVLNYGAAVNATSSTITGDKLGFNLDVTAHSCISTYTYKWQFSTGTITGATNASPIVVTSTSHGLATGAIVVITNVLGNTAANGTWTITVVDANSFSLNTSTGNGAYVAGGKWGIGIYGWFISESLDTRAMIAERFAAAPIVVGGSRLTLAMTIAIPLRLC